MGALLLIHYICIRPIIICDPDDWTYISYIRQAVPLWGAWNPAKIFPETIEGLLGDFAAFVIYPIVGKWGYAMSYVFGIFLVICILIYVYAFSSMIRSVYELNVYQTCICSFMFLILHFLVLKSSGVRDKYLLTATNANCFMNYLVPALFCSSLGFSFIKKRMSMAQLATTDFNKGIFFFLLYMAVFSNMASNIVLLAPIIYYFFADVFQLVKDASKSGKDRIHYLFVGQGGLYSIVIVLEMICLVYESQGGRANDLEMNLREEAASMAVNLKMIINDDINKGYLYCMMGVIVIAVTVWGAKKKAGEKIEARFLNVFKLFTFCTILCSIYTIALFIRVGADKILRCENIMVMYMYFIVLSVMSLGYILRQMNKTIIAMPTACFILFINACIPGGGNVYKQSGTFNMPMYKNEQIIESVIGQFQEADKNNQTEIDLHYPSKISLSDGFAQRISNTLYNHGIIEKNMTVHVVPDESLDVH